MPINRDFILTRYGISVRLVVEEDADFIVHLRTDKKLSKFLHSTDPDVEKQIKWIREYKKREEAGCEYYFLYFKDNVKLGVTRIYNIINKEEATGGSWICPPTNTMEQSVSTLLLGRDIFFEILGFTIEHFQVSKGNNQVLNFHKRMGAEIVSENEVEYELNLRKDIYLNKREKIIKLLNI